MRESEFVDQNKQYWEHYEKLLKTGSKEPDELNDLFIQVTDDLSYARTYYPNRTVRVYLNNLAQTTFQKIYGRKKNKISSILKFYGSEIPLIIFKSSKELFICLFIFALCFCSGVYSSRNNPDFANKILGSNYVEMTKSNISEGKPMKVYSQGNSFQSFFLILYNNLRVDVLTFCTGLFLAIGSLFVLGYNGIMVGVFQYLFFATGYLSVSILTIWLHGTIEIFTMVLSATAGLVFGRGLLFPATFTRFQAFRISASKGIKIMLAVLPLTIFAAAIEAFITGQEEIPSWVKLIFILINVLFILVYFFFIPFRRHFRTKTRVESFRPIKINKRSLDNQSIKNIGEIISDSLYLWKQNLRKVVVLALISSVSILLLAFLLENKTFDYEIYSTNFVLIDLLGIVKSGHWFSADMHDSWLLIAGLCLMVYYFSFMYALKRFYEPVEFRKIKLLNGVASFGLSAIMYILFFQIGGWLGFFVFLLLIHPIVVVLNLIFLKEGNLNFSKGIAAFFSDVFYSVVLNLILLLLVFVFYLIINSTLTNFIIEALMNALYMSDPVYIELKNAFIQMIALFVIFVSIPLFVYGNVIHFFSAYEKYTAFNLRKSMEKVWL
ncbi:MAG: stage II sporulation protein M [Flavobacteriales bacterium]|nr:stage II sporulation protein M [Flavobacteriales bacterium]